MAAYERWYTVFRERFQETQAHSLDCSQTLLSIFCPGRACGSADPSSPALLGWRCVCGVPRASSLFPSRWNLCAVLCCGCNGPENNCVCVCFCLLFPVSMPFLYPQHPLNNQQRPPACGLSYLGLALDPPVPVLPPHCTRLLPSLYSFIPHSFSADSFSTPQGRMLTFMFMVEGRGISKILANNQLFFVIINFFEM